MILAALWVAAAEGIDLAPLINVGAVGVILLAVGLYFRKYNDARIVDLQAQRDRALAELSDLNRSTREVVIPAVVSATEALERATTALAEVGDVMRDRNRGTR